MDNQKETCVILARVSTKEQEETGYSLEAQEKLLIEYGNRCNFHVAKIFSISETASKHHQRKIFHEMLKYLKDNNIQHLLVEKVDRLTRNLKDAVIINDWLEQNKDRKLHFVKQNLVIHKDSKSDERFRWDIEIVLAKKYTANLSEEVKKGQMEKIAQGQLPTKSPDGYKTIGDKGHKIHVIDDNTAPLVRKMFEFYATGTISLERLADKMYDLGLRKRSGLKMELGKVHQSLQDPFYYGMLKWNKKIYPGKQEPLITKELYDKVQEVRTRKEAPTYQTHADMLFRKIFT
ncbi:MAG: recombinase family protein, partial [Patescibacteria group bacterium]